MTQKIASLLIVVFVAISCTDGVQSSDSNEISKRVVKGEAQGTTYSIVYYSETDVSKKAIDSLLLDIDNSLSNWNKKSRLYRYNNERVSVKLDNHLLKNIKLSVYFYVQTNGAFNPLIKPLIDYYGLGSKSTNIQSIDSVYVKQLVPKLSLDSLFIFDGRKKIPAPLIAFSSFSPDVLELMKPNKHQQLDFNAVAQGYSVDIIKDYLRSKNITSFLIELGGEMFAEGKHPDGRSWLVGIDKPLQDPDKPRELQAKLTIENRAIATSGNYRKYASINGRKVHHTIDPITGYPATNSLLSVSVLSSDCASADAWATSFMVLGLEESKKLLASKELAGLDAFFIYSNYEGAFEYYATPAIQKELEVVNE